MLFANGYLAYELLSDGMKEFLDGMIAINSSTKADVTREDRGAFMLADELGFVEGLCRRARHRPRREYHLLRDLPRQPGGQDQDHEAQHRHHQYAEHASGEPPYNLKGKYWNINVERQFIPELGQGYIAKPLQRPHPPIVVTAVAPFSKGVTEAAARGWDPISANFLMPAWVNPQLAEIRRGL